MATSVHRIRYYNPQPTPVNCIAYNKLNKQLSLARKDSSIEIWDMTHFPFLLKFIPAVKDGSVEALGWVKDRLLTTGLGGALVEWNLEEMCIRNTILLTGYAAWCLDVSPDNTLVAVGTEQGYVNLYNVENDDIIYKKLFDKQEGRILCCKFNETSSILVTGSVNTIRVWNVETGHATTRISVSRRGKEVIVWSLVTLENNIIASGDSLGRLTLWDGNTGDEIESFISHKADILTIAVSEDKNNLFCSGVDPTIIQFRKIKKKSDSANEQWVKSYQNSINQHDVRDIAVLDQKVLSVGVDGYISTFHYVRKGFQRIPHLLPTPRSLVCSSKKFLLLRYSNHLEVWKLGAFLKDKSGRPVAEPANVIIKNKINTENNHSDCEKVNEMLKISENPVKLLSLQTKGKKQIQSCAISPNGELIVYSTESHTRMLKLDSDDESNVYLSKVILNGSITTCSHFAFTEDSKVLIVYNAGTISFLQVDPEAGVTVTQTINTKKHLSCKSILHFQISKKCPSNKVYLVVADTQGDIVIWTQIGKKFEHYITLPKYHCVPSAMVVDAEKETLIVAYVDRKVVEYELFEKKFSDWPGSAMPPVWYDTKQCVLSVHPHPSGQSVVFQHLRDLFVLDRKAQFEMEPTKKKKSADAGEMNLGYHILPMKYLSDFYWLGKSEAVTVEILPENIMSMLPPVAIRNKRSVN